MRVLVTGANGFLGRRVVQALLDGDHRVRALVRPVTDVRGLGWDDRVDVFRADLRGGVDLGSAFDGVDALVHLATQMVGDDFSILGGTLTGTERLFDALVASPLKRVVLISSFSVYDWRLARGKHDERTPLLADVYSAGAYAAAKRWQERMARRAGKEHGLELTILRPSFIWGAGNDDLPCIGQRVGSWFFVFGPRRKLALTHVDNCAAAIRAATESPRAIGEIFDVEDGQRVGARVYARAWARANDVAATRIVGLPYFLVRFGIALANVGSRLCFGKRGKLPSMFVPVRFELRYKPLRFSGEKLRKRTGWLVPYAFPSCAERTWSAVEAGPPARPAKAA